MDYLEAMVKSKMHDICELLEGSNSRKKGPKITQTGLGMSGSTAKKISKLDFPR
jgi:hypothetical protein